MRQVKLFIASSLDGYIARQGGEIDWLFHDEDYGYTPFFSSIDTVLIGRRTYDLARAFPEWPYADKEVVVFSRSRAGTTDGHARFVEESPAALVAQLRSRPGRDLWLVGGGELIRAFLDADLVDRFDLFIHPVLLGSGLPLFPSGGVQTPLKLASTTTFRSGLVQLAYGRPGKP